MFTRAEKGYLALTLGLLAAGSGLKALRLAHVRIGPFADPAFVDSRTTAPIAADTILSDIILPNPNLPDTSAKVNDSSSMAIDADVGKPRSAPSRAPAPRPAKSAFTGKVDLNRAPAAELTRVKGIGEKTASAIVEYRTAHGPFRDLRDLLQVKGIGEKKLEKLGPYLIL
jgi:competence ComEA-like helix-hairpin-helix protein